MGLQPRAKWVELRMPHSGRLVAKFDPRRGVLEVRHRGEEATFDVVAISDDRARDEARGGLPDGHRRG